MRLDQIEVADVDDSIALKRRKRLSGSTLNRHLKVLRRVFSLALRTRKMTTNPALLVDPLDEPDRRLRWRRLTDYVRAVPRWAPQCDHERRRGWQLGARGHEAGRSLGLRVTQQYLDLAGVDFAEEGRESRRPRLRPCASGKSWGKSGGRVAGNPAGATGIEPATSGFGDQRSAS
jgi:hypothetical protein